MLIRLKVRVIPNARKNAVVGFTDDELRLKLHAPAVEGKANAALIEYLSELTQVPRSKIRIKVGEKARTKLIELDGPGPDEVWDRIRAWISNAS
jgi:uncharacterized protein (TIGR00251 family)